MNAKTTDAAKPAETAEPAKTFYATRDFRDTGTGKAFKFGAKIDADEGSIGNYEAAGLASDTKPEATKPADAA